MYGIIMWMNFKIKTANIISATHTHTHTQHTHTHTHRHAHTDTLTCTDTQTHTLPTHHVTILIVSMHNVNVCMTTLIDC